jgi:hypothetical protein
MAATGGKQDKTGVLDSPFILERLYPAVKFLDVP